MEKRQVLSYNDTSGLLDSLITASLIPLRGPQLTVVPHRMQQSGNSPATTGDAQTPATAAKSMPPATLNRGRASNAVEYVITKLDDLVNYARKVKLNVVCIWLNSFQLLSLFLNG